MPDGRVAEILASAVAGTDRSMVLERLCGDCGVALRASVGVGLTASSGLTVVACTTDDVARRMAEAAFALDEGPCVDAARDGRPVMQPHLADTGSARWPAFSEEAAQAGVAAVFALPLQVGAIRLGALGLYRCEPGSLTGSELADALAYADAATLVLLHLQDRSLNGDMNNVLLQPFDDRAAVHQATGMISVQLSVSLPEALLRMRAHAYAYNRPLVDVAASVVDRRLRFDHSDAGHTVEDDS